MKKNKTNAFTLVELLAVIVILAIILVIAVPKVMSVIEDSKKATLESTAKMIASAAEKAKVQNAVLGKKEEITCNSVAKLNDVDYDYCGIEFKNDNALVTIAGSGKFEGLYVCKGDKTNATSTTETCNVEYGNGAMYINKLLAFKGSDNGLINPKIEFEGITYDTGIRYSGNKDEVNNKVYYNCDDTDSNGASYGDDNYDYGQACEVWRIIGVFEVQDGTGTIEKRIKLINTASIFKAAWDSSSNSINKGFGINQWGESTYKEGAFYEGADLMKLLNEYYIGESGSECKYCIGEGQAPCNEICTVESLKNANMKVLTGIAKGMIENAVWDTYGVMRPNDGVTDSTWSSVAYLEEKGISTQYTGKSLCEGTTNEGGIYCTDIVNRTTNWTGLVGLMSVVDITYTNGWLYDPGTNIYPWSISPVASDGYADLVWSANNSYAYDRHSGFQRVVWPSIYLRSNVEIIGGNGSTEPYKLHN